MPKRAKPVKNRWQIIVYFYLLLILLTLLTVASYTWFSISQTPRVSDMYMFINTVTGLELSTDPEAEEWKLQLDFREMVPETAPLRPITWSDAKEQFYAAVYGMDGRLFDIDSWIPLTDERNANKDNVEGYYIKATFFARSGQNVMVSLSPAVEVQEGIQGSGTYVIGTPLWDEGGIIHNNGGQGAECAIRIGFKITPVDQTGEPIGQSNFLIYEPNSDLHVQSPRPAPPPTEEPPEEGTPETEPPPTDPPAEAIQGYMPTPSIDDTPNLIDDEHLILQSASTWTEAYPVQRGVVIHELGEFTTSADLFTLAPDEMVKIDLYIWLEGQDVDCTTQITEAQILASIQFATTVEGQSGLVPIE